VPPARANWWQQKEWKVVEASGGEGAAAEVNDMEAGARPASRLRWGGGKHRATDERGDRVRVGLSNVSGSPFFLYGQMISSQGRVACSPALFNVVVLN
jgi:hypothetical protein